MMFAIGEKMPEVHVWTRESTETLCEKVDICGGWNPDAVCVKFYHGVEPVPRSLAFSSDCVNSGYWTVCLTKDDYYWSKVSDKKKAEYRTQVRLELKRQVNAL